MASNLSSHTVRLGRGLNVVDAPELMREGECRLFRNVRLTGGGRVTTRRAMRQMASIAEPVIAGIAYTQAAGVAAIALTYASSTVKLYTLDASGASTLVGTLAGWSGVSSDVKCQLAVLNGIIWICDEGKSHGLTAYDPNLRLGGSALIQPEFDFDDDGTAVPMLPRVVVEHLNHLWVFGYGDDADQDRGEYGRWSYLGLFNAGQGSGDAGSGTSSDLFDFEDAVALAPRGEEVIAASSAPGRLLVLTNRQAAVIYGSDRSSWRMDKIDSERGAVNGSCVIEADGVAYWMSPLGPTRYRGGGAVEKLERRILPLIETMDLETCFAVHAVREHQVRWYYRRKQDEVDTPDRFLGWDYLAEEWIEDRMSVGVRCGFHLRPNGLEGPDGNPSGLTHTDVTDRSAVATWTPGDPNPDTRTKVYLKEDGGTYRQVATLDGGADRHTHSSLERETVYWTKVVQVRNGQATSAVEASFTTRAVSIINEPELIVSQFPWWSWGDGGRWVPAVGVRVTSPQNNIKFILERDDGGGYEQLAETEIGADSMWYIDFDVETGSSYDYRAWAENEDGIDSSKAGPETIVGKNFPEADPGDFDDGDDMPYGGPGTRVT